MPTQPTEPTKAINGNAGTSTTSATPRTAARSGWHWGPWLCEFLGTAILLAGGLSAVFLDFGRGSPIAAHLPDTSARLLVTGLLFAGTGSLVALSPIGRRSGAHLNPAVTLAFWTQHKVHPHDLAGYILAQLAGALTPSQPCGSPGEAPRERRGWVQHKPGTFSARSTHLDSKPS